MFLISGNTQYKVDAMRVGRRTRSRTHQLEDLLDDGGALDVVGLAAASAVAAGAAVGRRRLALLAEHGADGVAAQSERAALHRRRLAGAPPQVAQRRVGPVGGGHHQHQPCNDHLTRQYRSSFFHFPFSSFKTRHTARYQRTTSIPMELNGIAILKTHQVAVMNTVLKWFFFGYSLFHSFWT